jgi:RecQ family ATP-dependent DNA helicase
MPGSAIQSGDSLSGLLQRVFGFATFRANQEPVCRAVADGHDVLVVMPTGSGKSLCYQLPALARGGTAVVISPLIALMDDQTTKLAELGVRVGSVHSGLDRSTSRQACVAYLNGSLDFLFIAPERLRVPGFAEMLAKRKPSLIAVDEAHCISQWGHDFRPDYRMLDRYIPALRPAPVIALTATATPMVQEDIVRQLGLVRPHRFIHGFRRDNLAIEVVELPPALRGSLTSEFLSVPERRPAIIYTPTRKGADTLATVLSLSFPAAAYHGGMDAGPRRQVQEKFLSGELEAIVATIAFGMGIDKPDVRTVVHTALPGSLEAYYQEIGRAGRDGNESRTLLMHSFADRRTHDFFLDRDYPAVDILDRICRLLREGPRSKEELRVKLDLDAEIFENALEKLAVHGGCTVDYPDKVVVGRTGWSESYATQLDHRKLQIELAARWAETDRCRMAAIALHFGDVEDGSRSCGKCDFCSPRQCIVQTFRSPTKKERQALYAVVGALRSIRSKSTGKLHKEIFPAGDMSRDSFEQLLSGLARAGVIDIEDEVFKTEGRSVVFRRATLTAFGGRVDERTSLDFTIKAASGGVQERADTKPRPRSTGKFESPLADSAAALELQLRDWRLHESRERGVPAFHLFSNRTLRSIAESRPTTLHALRRVPGVGPVKSEAFGAAICEICAASPSNATEH